MQVTKNSEKSTENPPNDGKNDYKLTLFIIVFHVSKHSQIQNHFIDVNIFINSVYNSPGNVFTSVIMMPFFHGSFFLFFLLRFQIYFLKIIHGHGKNK